MSCSDSEQKVNPKMMKELTPKVNEIQVSYAESEDPSKGKIKFTYSFKEKSSLSEKSIIVEINCWSAGDNHQITISNNETPFLNEGIYFVEYVVNINPISKLMVDSRLPLTKISKPIRYSKKLVDVKDGFITNIHVVFQ